MDQEAQNKESRLEDVERWPEQMRNDGGNGRRDDRVDEDGGGRDT